MKWTHAGGGVPDTERRATIRQTKSEPPCLGTCDRPLVRAAGRLSPARNTQPLRQCLPELPGNLDQFLDRLDRVIKHRLLLGIQFDFNDLLDPARAQDDRDADIDALDAVFHTQAGGARLQALLALEVRSAMTMAAAAGA